MVLSPLNTIWLSIDFAVKNKIYRKKEQDRHVKAQRVIPLWNFDFHARTLAKYGKQPYITKAATVCVKAYQSNLWYSRCHTQNEAVSVTGFTAAFF
jgi:hypothetical protein